MSLRKYRKPRKIKVRNSIFKTKIFWIFLLSFILIVAAIYFAFFSDFFQVKEIHIVGTEKIDGLNLRNLTEEKIKHNFLFLNTKSIFLIPISKMQSNILKDFPGVESVKIRADYPSSVVVEVAERKPQATFCQIQTIVSQESKEDSDNDTLISHENCFHLDKWGIAFEEILKGENFVVYISSLERNVTLGEKIIEPEILTLILEIGEFFDNTLKLPILKFSLLENNRVNVLLKEGWEAYFDLSADVNWQTVKLSLVLEKEIPQERRQNLEYIDVRHGNFAPYRYLQHGAQKVENETNIEVKTEEGLNPEEKENN